MKEFTVNSVSELRQRFQSCIKYKRAARWRKPLLAPGKFVLNQLRKSLLHKPVGTVLTARAFHLASFTVVSGEAVSNEIISYGTYEDELTDAFLRLVQADQVVVDIGMHLGYFTALFAQLVGPRGQVHSFEPTPSTRELASANVNQFPQVTVHPFAVWSSQKTMTFRDYGLQWMGYNSFAKARLEAAGEGVPFEVETTTLDNFRQSLNRPIALVKIDAESAEKEILIGADYLLRTDRPLISLETGDYGVDVGSTRELVEYLMAREYAAWDPTLRGFRPHQLKERYDYDNLIFAPTGKDLTRI
jgi:FkbM family methyltransferase